MTRPVFAPTPDLVAAVVSEVRARRRHRNATAAAFAVLTALLMTLSTTHAPWRDARHGVDVTGPGPVSDSTVTAAPGFVPSPSPVATAPGAVRDREDVPVAASVSPRPRPTGTAPPTSRDRSSIRLYTDDIYEQVVCNTLPGSGWHLHSGFCLRAEARPAPFPHSAGAHLLVCRGTESSDDTLTFPDSLDLDVVVARTGGGVVWRWSDRHPGTGGQRTLRILTGTCFDWVVAWAFVDSAGRPVPYGDYEITVEPRAVDLSGFRAKVKTTYQPAG